MRTDDGDEVVIEHRTVKMTRSAPTVDKNCERYYRCPQPVTASIRSVGAWWQYREHTTMYMLRPPSSNYPGSPANSQPYGIRTAIYFAQQTRRGGGICVSAVNIERDCVRTLAVRIFCHSKDRMLFTFCLSRVARLVLVVAVPVCLLVFCLFFALLVSLLLWGVRLII